MTKRCVKLYGEKLVDGLQLEPGFFVTKDEETNEFSVKRFSCMRENIKTIKEVHEFLKSKGITYIKDEEKEAQEFKVHNLKIAPANYYEVCGCLFEIRKNDRDYKVGDHVSFCLPDGYDDVPFIKNVPKFKITRLVDLECIGLSGYVKIYLEEL